MVFHNWFLSDCLFSRFIYLCCSIYQDFIPCYGWIISQYMEILHSVCSSVGEHLNGFHFLTLGNNAAVNIYVWLLCVDGMDLMCILLPHHVLAVEPWANCFSAQSLSFRRVSGNWGHCCVSHSREITLLVDNSSYNLLSAFIWSW